MNTTTLNPSQALDPAMPADAAHAPTETAHEGIREWGPEVAVAAFLDRRLRFTGIAELVDRCLQTVLPEATELHSVNGLLQLDARTRRAAEALLPRG